MQSIAYHASHEQFAPSHLLKLVRLAEKAGFDAIHSSDHFHPWSVRQGQSGFTFSWIGAALQSTTIPFSMVCAPGDRYHPAIVAQAIATLCEMFPNRFDIELGSGEALNENITGEPWPSKNVRNERLRECVDIIRKLLKGDEVNHDGHVRVKEAKLYTLPEIQPKLFCAALSEPTSSWAASWADGLLTTGGQMDEFIKKRKAFHNNGGAGKDVYVQLSFSYARNKQDAIDGAHDQWRSNLVSVDKLAGLYKPEQFDNAGHNITKEQVSESIRMFTSMNELLDFIAPYIQNGATRIILHNLNRLQEHFIEDFEKSFVRS